MSQSDPNVLNKYKQGYSECVQECLKFVNNNSTNNLNSNGIDQATRQRLIANLMRQYQSISGPIQNAPFGGYPPQGEQLSLSSNSCVSMSPSPTNLENLSFRHSSVSPISATSSCSSSSSFFKAQFGAFSNPNEVNLSSDNILINTAENPSSCSSSSPKLLENSSSSSTTSEEMSVWRPW